MDRLTARFNVIFKRHEFFIFIGLWFWIAILFSLDKGTSNWGSYFNYLLLTFPVLAPCLIFSWLKPQLWTNTTPKKYLRYWLLCFLVCVPAMAALFACLFPRQYTGLYTLTAGATLALALLLSINSYYQNSIRHVKWIKKIGLENAVFISIVLFALTISIMAVSSMGNPRYDQKNNLLVGLEFSFFKVLRHFGTFISFFAQFLIMYLSGYLFFFINNRYLVAKVLKQQGLTSYILSLLTTVVILYPIIAQLLLFLPINKIFGRDIFSPNPFDLENAFSVIGIMILSLPIVLSLQWGKQNNQIISLEKEKSQAELDLLKQQLNPHFFFNTLNNLYALSLQKSDKTPESILQLAELMRYTIYKGQEKQVSLADELKYMEDYIQLQQIRLKKPLDLKFEVEISDDKQTIAPLMLIILIENAFKHGIEPAEEASFLRLKLSCQQKKLYFCCENSFEDNGPEKTSGIGLQNLVKRLELLYPDQHRLAISQDNFIFKAELFLHLS
ncbi:histidine kinase [Pedobacter sp. KR3-3]|uniref:Histidine kinase n=1 Tax=Pedobacter albus TaxID=3113905 RepID=A0ABU7I5M3_9SPHI|nr:histidine kinase [Pedobacter sp. KR3-3]MEE1944738.1 histidine kinase [Pedobacter sp. KR3-3]